MLAGHVGVALGLGRVERRLSVGVLLLGALLLDFVLWALVLSGIETVVVPADYAGRHFLTFIFPYSHSLAGACFWALLAGASVWLLAARWREGRLRASAVMAAAVFSHWILDALVHIPEMPVGGESTVKLGLGLWNRMPVALAVEGMIVAGGLWLLLSAGGLRRGQAAGLAVLTGVILALTVAGGTVAPAPPDPRYAAWSSLATDALIVLAGGWLGRRTAAGGSSAGSRAA